MKWGAQALSAIILFIFSISATGVHTTFANRSAIQETIIAKYNLKELPSGTKYANQIDSLIEKYKDNSKVLTELKNRSSKVLAKYPNPKSTSEQEIVAIMSYIHSKAILELDTLDQKTELLKRQKIEAEKAKIVETTLEEIQNSQLTSSEEKEVEKEILKIQKQIVDKSNSLIIELRDELEQYYNYKQKWDLSINADIKLENNKQFNVKALFENYEIIANNFDSQITTDIDLFFQEVSKETSQDAVYKFSAEADLISNEGEMYLLLKDLLAEGKNIDDAIDTLKLFAQENKYVKISDENSKIVYDALNNFNLDSFLEKSKHISEQPFLKAYKKEGNTYSLIPTQYACKTIKENMSKIYSYIGSDCNNSQYEELLTEFIKAGSLQLEINGNTNTLSFIVDENSLSMSYDDNNILAIIAHLQNGTGDKFHLDYKMSEYLNIEFEDLWYSSDLNFVFESTLDKENNFTFIDSLYSNIGKTEWATTTIADLSLKNRNIVWNWNSQTPKYDYTNRKYIPGKKLQAQLKGQNNYDNTLKDLTVTFSDDKGLSGSLTYENKTLSGTLKDINDNSKLDINFSAKYDSYEKLIRDGYLNINFKERKRELNTATWTYSYSWDLKEIFTTDIKIENKNITGKIIVNDQEKKIFTMNIGGNYNNKSCNLEFDFVIHNILDSNNDSSENPLNWKLAIKVDQQSNRGDLDINFNAQDSQDLIDIKVDIENRSTIEYGKFNISLPTNFIELEELLSNQIDM